MFCVGAARIVMNIIWYKYILIVVLLVCLNYKGNRPRFAQYTIISRDDEIFRLWAITARV